MFDLLRCQTHAPPPSPLIARDARGQDRAAGPMRRARIWELPPNLHCSIVGTCLSAAELRRVLSKAGVAGEGASDHALHTEAVRRASRHDTPAKLLHKALDERHGLAIRQFARAQSEAELRALWRAAKERGEVPGAYWATLSHPAAGDALIGEAFGDVHMLSHLVGAANRADIRRLSEQESARARLEAELREQQARWRAAIRARDARISELADLVAGSSARAPAAAAAEPSQLTALVGELQRRLGEETHRRRLIEERLDASRRATARERDLRIKAEQLQIDLAAELQALEAGIAAPGAIGPAARPAGVPPIDGLALLYVGGRLAQVGAVRALAERAGADFRHHDGGVENSLALLPGLVGRVHAVLFPIDCVSHAAAATLKQLCRRAGKPCVPLRRSGVASFLAALRRPELAGSRLACAESGVAAE
jgi:uncharacterized protein DUF2325